MIREKYHYETTNNAAFKQIFSLQYFRLEQLNLCDFNKSTTICKRCLLCPEVRGARSRTPRELRALNVFTYHGHASKVRHCARQKKMSTLLKWMNDLSTSPRYRYKENNKRSWNISQYPHGVLVFKHFKSIVVVDNCSTEI